MWTVGQVALFLGVCNSTVKNMVNDGRLSCDRAENGWRLFDSKEVKLLRQKLLTPKHTVDSIEKRRERLRREGPWFLNQ